jgi:hypothetical protein
MTTRVVGVDLGHADVARAEHWIRALDPAPVLACTHLVREPYPHVAISLTVAADAALEPTPEALRPVAAAVAAGHGSTGRAVVYDGVPHLVGTVSVADLLAWSAVEEVALLGGGAVGPDDLIVTRDFVRPQFHDGVLTLLVAPAVDGTFVPFEVPDPTPCCADH